MERVSESFLNHCFLLFVKLLVKFYLYILPACRPITFLTSLLEAEDRAVRIAAGEALALCFELKLLDVSTSEEADVDSDIRETSGSKNQLFLNMQALKAKISGLVYSLSMEAGGRGADKKNLNDQRDLFQRISDFIKV
jgi:hypothetical protein